MQFTINPRIFQDYPEVLIGIVLVTDSDNTKQKAAQLLQEAQSVLNHALNRESLDKHPQIIAWQEAYKKFGAKPKGNLSSIENLARRIVSGQEIKSINTLVDLYNTVSLKYLLPIGGEDLDTISGDIELTYADDQAKPVVLLGEQEARAPKVGEVIYKDDQGALCRRWNWKEAERSKITDHTKNAILVIEALPPVTREMLTDAVNELALLIGGFCGGSVSTTILDKNNPSVAIKKGTFFVQLSKPQKVSGTDWNVYHRYEEHDKHSDETKVRMQKVADLQQTGMKVWPEAKEVPDTCQQVFDQFETNDQKENYVVAGRLMSMRWHGKTAFGHVQDRTGRIQLYFKQEIIGEKAFEFIKHYIDLGDIIWVDGPSFKTKMGEITLQVNAIELLSKCLHPLPEKFHGLTDIETKYRQRYLDLISNPESKDKFITRSMLIKNMRSFLDANGFIEVETPMLHPIAGGATARPFVTHHNVYDSDFYLRIAPELYLKRLVVGGIERVYEINRNFRNEGVSTRHNPEFTMVEFYMAHQNYRFIMGFVEDLLRTIIKESCNTLQIPFGEHSIDFSKPFERISIADAVKKYTDLKAHDLSEQAIDTTLKKLNIQLANSQASYGEKIFALFEELVEPRLIQPTFVIDFPIEVSPLAKRDANNPSIAARFELFIAGMEIANGFNELNDPYDQAQRFKQQMDAHRAGDDEAHQYDADYILALEHALPPTVGVGIGIDRLTMLATNTTSIKDVILFPTLKKK